MPTGNDANILRLLTKISDLVAAVARCERNGDLARAEALRQDLERLRWLLAGAVSRDSAYSDRAAA